MMSIERLCEWAQVSRSGFYNLHKFKILSYKNGYQLINVSNHFLLLMKLS